MTFIFLKDGTVSTSSVFKLNKTYSNKRTKFKITAAAHKESTQVLILNSFTFKQVIVAKKIKLQKENPLLNCIDVVTV